MVFSAPVRNENGKLRLTPFQASPRSLSPDSTSVMINVIDERYGGIFCIGGKDVLPVGAEIWHDPQDPIPKPDAGWQVFYIKDKNSTPVEIPKKDWYPIGFDTSAAHVTRGTITATYLGERYQCNRVLTVIEKDEAGGVGPTIEDTSISNGFVGIAYDYQMTATGTEPILWSAESIDPTKPALPQGLPQGLVLESDGRIHGTPTQKGEFSTLIRATNLYGYTSRLYTIKVLDEHSLDVIPLTQELLIGQRITAADIKVRHLGNELAWGTFDLQYTPYQEGPQTVVAIYDAKLEEVSPLAYGSCSMRWTSSPQP